MGLLLLVFGAAGGGGAYWWHIHHPGLPIGIVSGNGRIEAQEIDIDTKFAGRVIERLVDEGDMVTAGQVVARMERATLKQASKQPRPRSSKHNGHSTKPKPMSCSKLRRSRSPSRKSIGPARSSSADTPQVNCSTSAARLSTVPMLC